MKAPAFAFCLSAACVVVPPKPEHGAIDEAAAERAAIPTALGAYISEIQRAAMSQAHQALAGRHKAAGVACQSCHGSGTVAFTQPVAETICTGCHGNYGALAAMTPMEPNPHRSHMGELACSTCHPIHKPSTSYCDQCHSFGMEVP
jgi:hypothetical protein